MSFLENTVAGFEIRHFRGVQDLREILFLGGTQAGARLGDDLVEDPAERLDDDVVGKHRGEGYHARNGEACDDLDKEPDSHGRI